MHFSIFLVNKSSEGVLLVSKSGLNEECVCKVCTAQSSSVHLAKCPVQYSAKCMHERLLGVRSVTKLGLVREN